MTTCDIRIMTFNIRGATYDDGVNAWSNRAALNVRTIQGHNPDVIGFQELETGNLKTYREHLIDYDYVLGLRYNRPGRLFYNAIFWKPARFMLTASGGFYLSSTPGKWSSAWDAARVHTAMWAKLRPMDIQSEFLFLNTHLDHVSHRARVESSKLIIRKISLLRHDSQPVIVVGDFNAPPEGLAETSDTVYHTFMVGGFQDTYRGAKPSNTVHGFRGGQFSQDDLRLDWILTLNGSRAVQTRSCAIVRAAEPPLYPSDHYPVIADLTISS